MVRVVESAHWDLELGAIAESLNDLPDNPILVFDKIPGYPAAGSGRSIGTNPKIRRPTHELRRSSYRSYERLRAGVIHFGFGTAPGTYPERWAVERELPYGHVHVHNYFATYEMTARDGKTIRLIDRGRLTALDDPEVVALASRLGDAAELLREDWTPAIPGLSAPGDYWRDYAPDPARWAQ